MRSIIIPALAFAICIAAWSAGANEPPSAGDERSSTFVAGAADPDEAFGPVEGPILMGVASALLVAIFILLLFSARAHRKSSDRLNRLEMQLNVKGDPHV